MVTAIIAAGDDNPDTGGAKPSLQKSFSIKDKMELVQAINIMVSTSISCRQAYSWVSLHHIYYKRFKKVIEKFDALKKSDVYIPYKTNGTARKIHPCPPVCCPQSKMIWLVLLCMQGAVEFR